MKKLALILTMFAMPALAVGPAPEYLQGGTITVTLKNGKTYTYSADEYAVVKRGAKSAPSAEEGSEQASVPVAEPKKSKHRLSLLLGGGIGPSGLGVSSDPNRTAVEERMRPVGTAGLCALKDGGGVCGTVGTNKSMGVQFLLPLGRGK